MAVKNLQTVALCVANSRGVRVTGTECNASMHAMGSDPAPFLFLPWRSLPGLYPIRREPATAEAFQRTGRSARRARVNASTQLTRSVSRTVLSRGRSAKRFFQRAQG
jgi:hypothetical protein